MCASDKTVMLSEAIFPLSGVHTALRFLCFVPTLNWPTAFLILVTKQVTYRLTRDLSSPLFTTRFRSQLVLLIFFQESFWRSIVNLVIFVDIRLHGVSTTPMYYCRLSFLQDGFNQMTIFFSGVRTVQWLNIPMVRGQVLPPVSALLHQHHHSAY